jgi:hypothetical protein
MKRRTPLALAAVVLLSSVTVASAATILPTASDTLNLTHAQQETAWHDL